MQLKLTYIWIVLSMLFTTCAISAESSTAYKLNQGDSIFISVWGEDTLQKEVKVLPDGSISFPLAGRIEVANTTAPEVEKRITDKLKTYLSYLLWMYLQDSLCYILDWRIVSTFFLHQLSFARKWYDE